MPIEKNGPMARPRLPRARELQALPGAETPSGARGPSGRFAPGNRFGVDARARGVINSQAASTPAEALARIDRDAATLYRHTLRELRTSSAMVRNLVQDFARQSVLAAYYHRVAVANGLSGEVAVDALERSQLAGQRAERLLVSAVDISGRTKSNTPDVPNLAAINARAERETEARRRRPAAPIAANDGGKE